MQKILKIKRSIISVCFLFVIVPLFAQNQIHIRQKANFIDADNLGNVYLVDNAEILKYDSKGELKYRFSDAMLGQITSIDVTNPLRIMLFYQESNALLFLNQQLAIINDVIYLSDFSNAEGSLACSSAESGFWIFDELTRSLLYFDKNNTMIKQSVNLAGYLHHEVPIQLSEQNQKLYLQTETKVYVFDVYGNFLKSYHLGSIFKIQATKNELCYFTNGKLICYNVFNFSDTIINASVNEPCKQIVSYKNLIVELTEDGVWINTAQVLIER